MWSRWSSHISFVDVFIAAFIGCLVLTNSWATHHIQMRSRRPQLSVGGVSFTRTGWCNCTPPCMLRLIVKPPASTLPCEAVSTSFRFGSSTSLRALYIPSSSPASMASRMLCPGSRLSSRTEWVFSKAILQPRFDRIQDALSRGTVVLQDCAGFFEGEAEIHVFAALHGCD